MSGSLKKIESMVCTELDEIANRNVMNLDTLDAIDKLTHTLKSIECILSMDKTHANGPEEDAKTDEDKATKAEALLKEFAEQIKSL